jgi:hypothetical protein
MDQTLEPSYMNGKGIAKKGHIVMTPGYVRALVVGINGTFLKVHGFATHVETGELVILEWVHDLPASDCVLLEDQALADQVMGRLGMR